MTALAILSAGSRYRSGGGSPVTTVVDDNAVGSGNNQFNYVGSWGISSAWSDEYLGGDHYSNTSGDYYTVTWSSTGVTSCNLYCSKNNTHCIAGVSIDGGAETPVDLYASAHTSQVLVFSSGSLGAGTHTIKVRNTGTKNTLSGDFYLNADRIDLINATVPTGGGGGGGGGGGVISTGTTIGLSSNTMAAALNYENTLKIKIGVVGAYYDRAWPPGGEMANAGNFTDTANWRNGDTRKTLDIGVPLGYSQWGWIGPDSAFDYISSGQADGAYNAAFTMTKNQGWLNPYLRIGWEGQQQVSAGGMTAAKYIAAFQRVATLARNILPACRTVYCPNGQGGDISACYPGDNFVDGVGLDAYYWDAGKYNPNVSSVPNVSATDAINAVHTNNFGLDSLLSFAAAHHKFIVIGEWANTSNSNPPGAGDSTACVDDMFNFCSTNNVRYACWFDYPENNSQFGANPNSFNRIGVDWANTAPTG